jgi:hypothetical protein
MGTGLLGAGETTVSLGSVRGSERCRLIGVAIEVNNTSAEIYKQGSLTVAQLPDVANDTYDVLYADTGVTSYDTNYVQADEAVVQASSLLPLLSVPGSCTWQAADGVYAVPRMTEVPRTIRDYDCDGVTGAAPGRVPVLYGTDNFVATPNPASNRAVSGYEMVGFWPTSPSGFSPLQIWFSGLSNATTLVVSFRTIVEYFPHLDSALLPLASPSPPFDPKVLALYSATVVKAPYAVPVGQNAAGDYFRKILTALGQGMQLVAPIFGGYAPFVLAAGKLATAGGSMLRSRDEKVRETGPIVAKNEAGPRSKQVAHRK